MTPPQFLSVVEKLDLVLDVLRANGLHQQACAWLVHRRECQKEMFSTDGFRAMLDGAVVPCDCWLSDPQGPPALDERELRVDVYTSGMDSPRGVRVTHLPTGITVTKSDRSQTRAKSAAMQELAEKVASRDD